MDEKNNILEEYKKYLYLFSNALNCRGVRSVAARYLNYLLWLIKNRAATERTPLQFRGFCSFFSEPLSIYKYCLFILGLFSILISGCSLNPDYAKPEVRIPEQWSSHDKHIIMTDSVRLPELAWWQQFDDPQLNNLIQEALQQNNDVHLALANLENAQAELKQVQLNWIPGVSVWTGYSQMPNLGNPGSFFGVFPLYAINIFQQIKQQKSAEYQLEASEYAKDSVRLTVIGQVSASYFTLLAQTQSLQYEQALLKNNQNLLELYQSQYRFGIISQDDIEKQKSQIQQIQSQIAITQHNIFVSKNALHFLLNQNPGNMLLKNSFKNIDSNTIIPGNLPASVLNNRPDIQASEALLKAATANIGVASSNLLPSIRLDSFLGDSEIVNGYSTLNEAYTSIPVLEPTVFGQIKSSQAEYKAGYIQYINTIRKALQSVDNDLSAYSAYTQQLESNQLAWTNEMKECQLVNSRYRHGIDSQVEVIQCQIKLDDFSLLLNQNKLEKMMTIVALYQDLAGGYRHGT